MNKSAIAREIVLKHDGPNATAGTINPSAIIRMIMDKLDMPWPTASTYFYNSRKQIAAGNLNPKRGRPVGTKMSDEAKAARLAAKEAARAEAEAAAKALEAKKEAQKAAKRERDRASRARRKAAKQAQHEADGKALVSEMLEGATA